MTRTLKSWNDEELQILETSISLYPNVSSVKLANLIQPDLVTRTIGSISQKIASIKVTKIAAPKVIDHFGIQEAIEQGEIDELSEKLQQEEDELAKKLANLPTAKEIPKKICKEIPETPYNGFKIESYESKIIETVITYTNVIFTQGNIRVEAPVATVRTIVNK
jgi:hypothetical protein